MSSGATDEELFQDLIEEESEYFCEQCDFTSETSEALLTHLTEFHKRPRIPNPANNVLYYDESKNTTVMYMCSLCYTPFPSIDEVKMHMMKDHKLKEKKSESPTLVPDVDKSEVLNLSLKDLKDLLLKSAIYRCTIKGCPYRFENPERRDIHLKCHSSYSKVREFKCFDCGEKQKRWRNCCMHLWKVHHVDVDLLRCPICPFKAQNTVKIFKHLQIHGNEGFPCLECTKVFPTYRQLRRHSLTHQDIQKNSDTTRWYSQKTCQICLNVFANSKTLTKHMKRHNKIVSYRCNICNKGSTNKATWLIHMRQHTGKNLDCG